MKLFFKFFVLTFSAYIFSTGIVIADELGRLFTTPKERVQLEKARHAKPKEVEVVEVEEIIEPVEVKKEIIERDQIKLRGLVYRSDGKNTAWVNESNTFEGDLDSQYIQIPNEMIKPDSATVVMPDDETNVDLKVGDVFNPKPLEKYVTSQQEDKQ